MIRQAAAPARWSLDEAMAALQALADPAARETMARFAIVTERALGVSVPKQRALAKRIGRDHRLAAELWATGVHEARTLAALIDEPSRVTRAQMRRWVRDLDSWDVCDGCCMDLFDKTPYAIECALAWAGRREEYVKRAGFVLMAALAAHDKAADDGVFLAFLLLIRREAGDERNFVKKAVNWALRQIGKRNFRLRQAAIDTAIGIRADGSRSGRWIAADALRELQSASVERRQRARGR
ncbi:MAG: DNA alkylation repair protein [Dehalococcoidia bacterium]|nr:DNA alkylation repair protein [Dehalococcoidia bacterium]